MGMNDHLPVPDPPPFVLSCFTCDNSVGIENVEQAVAQGWKALTFDPSGLSWTHIGICPECDQELEQPIKAGGPIEDTTMDCPDCGLHGGLRYSPCPNCEIVEP